MRFSDIEALFAEARRVNLSVRDAIITAMQELCASDSRKRAHRLDIFNAVFLKRMCSPNSVSLLLYTLPCFEQLGEGYFRYIPTPGEALQRSPYPLCSDQPAEDSLPPEVFIPAATSFVPQPVKAEIAVGTKAPEPVLPELPKISVSDELSQPAAEEPVSIQAEQTEPVDAPILEDPFPPDLELPTEHPLEPEVNPFLEEVEPPVKTPASNEIPQPVFEIPAAPLDELGVDLYSEETRRPAIAIRIEVTPGLNQFETIPVLGSPVESFPDQTEHPPRHKPGSAQNSTRPRVYHAPLSLRIWIRITGWLKKIFGE